MPDDFAIPVKAFSPINPAFILGVQRRGTFYAAAMALTGDGILANLVADALLSGKSPGQLSADIQRQFNSWKTTRADLSAQTTMTWAHNFGKHQGMKGVGVEYKAWKSAEDDRVRPSHAAADRDYHDNPIPIDGAFIVGGEGLQHPGEGSPSNSIRCRCALVPALRPEEEVRKPVRVGYALDEDEYQKALVKRETSWKRDGVGVRKRHGRGYTLADHERDQMRAVQKLMDEGELCVKVPAEALDKIIESGGLKNYFESGMSRMAETNYAAEGAKRAELEKRLFGYPLDHPASKRPIYAYMTTPGQDQKGTFAFGEARMVLKPQLKNRATVMNGDSYYAIDVKVPGAPANRGNYASLPSRVNGIEHQTIPPYWNDWGESLANRNYWEAHIHEGGVSLGDIEAVYFPYTPDAGTVAKLEALGIRAGKDPSYVTNLSRRHGLGQKYPEINVDPTQD